MSFKSIAPSPRPSLALVSAKSLPVTMPFTPGTAAAAFASKALLDMHPDPSEEQVRYWLAGNLCRCTGYDKIVRAVLGAAAKMRSAQA